MEIKFFKTAYHFDTKKKKHNHIMYSMGNEYCLVTKDKGHSHEVTPIYATGEVQDERGNVIEAPTDFRWKIEPSGEDLHTHDGYELFEVEEHEKKQDKDKEVQNAYDLLDVCVEREELSRLLGEESIDYCDKNKMWTDQQKKILNSQSRACLTLNSIKPKIDILEGHFRQNRKQIAVNPVEGGDQVVADVLNYTLKHIMNECNYFEEENQIFHNVMVPGRGIFHSYINRDTNFEGDIIVESFDWDGVYFGPHKKYDGSDLEHAHKVSWHSIAELQKRYPRKAKDILKNYEAVSIGTTFTNNTNEDDANSTPTENTFAGVDPSVAIDLYRKQFLLMESYQKEYFDSNVIIDSETGVGVAVDNWSFRDIDRLKTIPNLVVIPRVGFRIKVLLTAGYVHIDSYYLDEKYRYYKNPIIPLFPAYCYRSPDGFTGKVEMLKDPQNEKNKHRSLMADLAIKYLNSVTYIDKEMFETASDMFDFQENGNSPGAIVRLRNVNHRPIREEGFRFPDGLFNMVQISEDEIKGIGNVPDEMAGQQSHAEESGVAIHRKIQQSLVGNEIPFDNFSLTKLRAFKHVLRLIPECWNVDRFKRLLQHGMSSKKGIELNGKKVVGEDYQPKDGEKEEDFIYLESVLQIIHNADLSLYDVTLSETEFTPTMALANVAILLQALQYGQDIGPELINAMPLPQKSKDNIIAYQQQAAQAKSQEEQAKNQTEITKTQIANSNSNNQ